MATATNTLASPRAAREPALAPSLAAREENAWNRWWFAPTPPLNLGLCRALFFSLLLVQQFGSSYGDWPTLPASFVREIWLFKTLHLPILPAAAALALEVVWKASLFLSLVGLYTRASTALSFALGAYLIGLQYNYGKTDHMTALVVFTCGILALSRCGDGFSVDRLLRGAANRPAPPPSRPAANTAGRCGWCGC